MQKYELVVVLEPTRTEEQQTASLDKITEVVESFGGSVTERSVWGKRRLAYEISKRREGYYAVINFECATDNETLAELTRLLRISENVLRFLILKAVVGKSKGNPQLAEKLQRERHSGPPRGEFRRGGGGYDRGSQGGGGYQGRDRDSAPRESAPAANTES